MFGLQKNLSSAALSSAVLFIECHDNYLIYPEYAYEDIMIILHHVNGLLNDREINKLPSYTITLTCFIQILTFQGRFGYFGDRII